jgi:hypothetical protein
MGGLHANWADDGYARLVAVLATLSALVVPLLLLATWGHVYDRPSAGLVPFHGDDLQRGFRNGVFVLSGITVVIGTVAILQPGRYPALLLVATGAMAAEAVLIAVEWNNGSLFGRQLRWDWAPTTLVAALAASGVAALLWLALLVATLQGKRCPDCAERVRRSTIDCPHCGYRFPLSPHMKRCEACERPIKAEARVCRYCRHRFGEPVEPPTHAV